jgi:ferredoxin-NADP reductase
LRGFIAFAGFSTYLHCHIKTGLVVHNGRKATEANVLRNGEHEHHRILAQGSGGANDQK